MKTFGFNSLDEMGEAAEITGHYDAQQQLWVGNANSVAGSTSSSTSCTNGQCKTVTDNDPGGNGGGSASATSRSVSVNGKTISVSDSRPD